MFKEIIQRPNGRDANAPINPASLSLMRWMAQDYAAQQAHYIALRKWYDGDHEIPLTDRQKEYLDIDAEFEWALNYLRLPVDLCVERLTVEGFDGPDGIGGADGILWQWWKANRMDAAQAAAHRATIKDGDTYVIVEPPDDKRPYPQIVHNTAYDGAEGVKVHYLSNVRREMTMASKVWSESRFDDKGHIQTTQRLNLYMPDRIEKYENLGKGWIPYQPDGEAWPIPWPIGVIPVVHFRWGDDGGNWGRSELEGLVQLQMALNKSGLDLIEVSDKTGAQLLTLTGASWPSDAPEVRAGDVLSVSASDASWGSVPAGDLEMQNANVNHWIDRMAELGRLPLRDFHPTGQIASAATQEADDSQLVAKVSGESVAIGNAWEDVMKLALLIHAEYGEGPKPALGPDDTISTVWADFERVDRLALELRRAEILQMLVNSGVSIDGALSLPALGYTEEEQERMLRGDMVREGVTQ